MKLPAIVVEVVTQLYDRNLTLAKGEDPDRRKLTKMMGEQIRFQLGPDWGIKSRGPGSDQGKDALAHKLNSSDVGSGFYAMEIWTWQDGTSRKVTLTPNSEPEYPRIEDQYFIEVQAVNHLDKIPNPDAGNGNPPPDTDGEIAQALAGMLGAILGKLTEQNEILIHLVNVQGDLLTAIQDQTSQVIKTSNELQKTVNDGINVKFM